MKLGMFTMPSHPPERSLKDGHEWDLRNLVWADEYGFQEAWIGEHHAMVWEPHPSPDLLVVEGLRATKNIRIGPGGICLPYHHPAELANRIAMIDHISGGRLNFGIAASGSPTDWEMFGVDGMNGENREMVRESLEIIMGIWNEEPGWTYEGKHWKAAVPHPIEPLLQRHITPLQKPHPPIGVAGLSSPSPTLEVAGENGWIPMSLNLNPSYCKSHWDSVEVGARRAGRTVSRADWRMVREVFVAETDEEAWEWSVNNMMGRMMNEYFLPLLEAFGFKEFLKADPTTPDDQVTVEYCAEHNWLIGSPETVANRIEKVYAEVGGFGWLELFCFDYADNPEPWRRSMELLAKDVMPRVAHLTGE
ncbi:MAG: LLM class flavin-dependent oxidoreductase [Acidimicrobiia bacterium]|nr:LLM class flavin-dependent oxidoreductase [Acidimicrobiia bacterium]